MANIKRGPNFSFREIEKLIHLVKLHSKAINNKETDAVSNARKLEAWKMIEESFNADDACDFYRSHHVLRTKYDNLKKSLKKKRAARKSLCSNEDEDLSLSADSDIPDLLKAEFIAGNGENHHDFGNSEANFNDSSSDAIECVHVEEEKRLQPEDVVSAIFQQSDRKCLLEVEEYVDDVDDAKKVEYEWRTITPQILGLRSAEHQDGSITQSSDEPLSKKKKFFGDKLSTRLSCGMKFAEIQKEAFLEKHHLTLRLMKEEAELRMKHESALHALREEELRLRIKFMKEKHEAELQLMEMNVKL